MKSTLIVLKSLPHSLAHLIFLILSLIRHLRCTESVLRMLIRLERLELGEFNHQRSEKSSEI